MKITFLGTSHGVPAADRFCSCTMIEVGNSYYFIDAGAPLIDILLRRGVDLNRVKTIFTTHLHGDHVDGIIPLAGLFNWYYKTTNIDIYLTEQIGIDLMNQYIVATEGIALDNERVRFHLMTNTTRYDDGALRLTPIPTAHLGNQRPAFAYLVEAEGKKVLFSGDLSQKLVKNDFPECALKEDLDLVVCEMAHFGVEQVRPYLEKCTAKQVLFNHVFPLDKLDKINALSGAFGYPIHTVEDGQEVIL